MEEQLEHNRQQPPQEDEIDLVEIIRFMWDSRKTILVVFGIFIALGLFVALFSPVEYKTQARILPELRQQRTGTSSLMRQFQSLTGGSIMGEYEALRPDLYPSIVSASPFFHELLSKEIRTSKHDNPITVQEYVEEYMGGSPILGAARRYTVGLPRTILRGLRNIGSQEERSAIVQEHAEIPRLTMAEFEAMDVLRNRIQSDMDMNAWIISVSAEFPDPVAAQQIAQHAVDYLENYVVRYQINKAQEDLQFIESRYEEKKEEFHEAQQRLARHQDATRNIVSATARTEEQRLQHQYTLAFNLYNDLAQQLENARIRVQEETPVLTLLEPVRVPLERSQPKRTRTMVIYAFLGGVAGVGFVFGRREFYKLKEKLNEK